MKSEELDDNLKNLCTLKLGREVGLQKFDDLIKSSGSKYQKQREKSDHHEKGKEYAKRGEMMREDRANHEALELEIPGMY